MKSTKEELIARGKELGINLKKSMSIYEMNARIKEAEEALGKSKKAKEPAHGGEY